MDSAISNIVIALVVYLMGVFVLAGIAAAVLEDSDDTSILGPIVYSVFLWPIMLPIAIVMTVGWVIGRGIRRVLR